MNLGTEKEQVLAAVYEDGCALESASESLRADRDVVLTAVRADGYALEYAAGSLKDDYEVVFAAVRRGCAGRTEDFFPFGDGVVVRERASERLRKHPMMRSWSAERKVDRNWRRLRQVIKGMWICLFWQRIPYAPGGRACKRMRDEFEDGSFLA
jgi:hypothetical protein